MAVANWMFATVNRDEDTDPAAYPEPVPRPRGGMEPAGVITGSTTPDADPAAATAAQIVAFLQSP